VSQRVCVVTGVGPGTGAALVRRFAAEGYRVAMLARDRARLEKLAAEIPGTIPFPVDVADLDALRTTLARVRAELGAPTVVLHNAVAGGFGTFDTVKPEDLEARFRVNVTSLLVLAQELAPGMVAAGGGASRRRRAQAMAARRCPLASRPKWRIRTKPRGSTWSRNRRRNSSTSSAMTFVWPRSA
jgi:NAD(P)-dependent dehydrogenase (short-subunit alcohol dehydrogenase family)